MIRVERSLAPKIFESDRMQEFRQRLSGFFLKGGTRKTQDSYQWADEFNGFLPDVSARLLDQFNGKCAYSEVKLNISGNDKEEWLPALALHRPGSDALGTDNQASPLHYWWLIAEWSNWYVSSPLVSIAKGTQFPVIGPRDEVPADYAPGTYAQSNEASLLLDPCTPDPESDPAWHLAFYRTGPVGARDVFGLKTYSSKRLPNASALKGVHSIRVYDLNNARLLPLRLTAVRETRKLLKAVFRSAGPAAVSSALEALDGTISPLLDFTAARRQALVLDLANQLRREGRSDPKVIAEVLEFVVDRCPSELSASILCDRRYWDNLAYPLAPDIQKQLADHADRTFANRGLGDALMRHLDARQQYLSPGVVADGQQAGPATTGKPAIAISGSTAEDDDVVRPVVHRSDSITAIKIRNFKAINEVNLDFGSLGQSELKIDLEPSYGVRNQSRIVGAKRWWAFLGENGSGKSCLLQAISLALAGRRLTEIMQDCDLVWSSLLRRPSPGSDEEIHQGRILITFTGDTRIDLRFNARTHWWVFAGPRSDQTDEGEADLDTRRFSGEPDIQTFVRAYGATRLLQSGRKSSSEQQEALPVEISNLFDPRFEVTDAKSWLLSGLGDGDFNIAAPVISGLLEHDRLALENDEPDPAANEPLLARDRTREEVTVAGIPIELASDGYRAVIAMAVDIMRGLGAGLSAMGSATGIVLIDEIGAHLHPRWQMAITAKLRRLFPQVQFIVSTHEPLCLRGLRTKEVVRVEKHPGFGVLLDPVERDPSRLRVDQLLTSEFFGLDSTIDPDLERRFQHYYRLLAIPESERSSAETRTLNSLYRYLYERAPPSLGYTRRDQIIADEVDAYLAERSTIQASSPEDYMQKRRARRAEVVKRVRDIWDRRTAINGTG